MVSPAVTVVLATTELQLELRSVTTVKTETATLRKNISVAAVAVGESEGVVLCRAIDEGA